jgi:hypothetical protein
MGPISKNLVVTLALIGVSQRMAVAQPTSTEDDVGRRIDLAQSQANVGLIVEARATLGRILLPPPKGPDATGDARAKAQKLDDELKERLATLRFEVSGLSAGTLPMIWVDENVNPVSSEAPLRVNPGRHVVVAKTDSLQVTQTVDARERATMPVALAFAAAAPPAAGDIRSGLPASNRATGLPTAAYWGLGVGAAGFMVGSVTGILSLVSKKPNDPRCAASQCPPSSWNDYDPTQRALVRTSTASLLIGAAGVGLALGSILLRKKHEAAAASSARAVAESVRITPAAGGMALSGKW